MDGNEITVLNNVWDTSFYIFSYENDRILSIEKAPEGIHNHSIIFFNDSVTSTVKIITETNEWIISPRNEIKLLYSDENWYNNNVSQLTNREQYIFPSNTTSPSNCLGYNTGNEFMNIVSYNSSDKFNGQYVPQ